MRISDWSSDVCSSDLLTFPNLSRSYDARRDLVRFWGYDSALEVAFFVETSALCKLRPETGKLEAAYLDAFDAAREQILAVAPKVYSQEIGRASGRERVCQYVEISVVAVSLKKKNNKKK